MKLSNFKNAKGFLIIISSSLLLSSCGAPVSFNTGTAGVPSNDNNIQVASRCVEKATFLNIGEAPAEVTNTIITPSLVPSRTSGVAPLAVFFDATSTR